MLSPDAISSHDTSKLVTAFLCREPIIVISSSSMKKSEDSVRDSTRKETKYCLLYNLLSAIGLNKKTNNPETS